MDTILLCKEFSLPIFLLQNSPMINFLCSKAAPTCGFFRVLHLSLKKNCKTTKEKFLNKVQEIKNEKHVKIGQHEKIKPYLSTCLRGE